jgi:sugar lactone lactonase YvrE
MMLNPERSIETLVDGYGFFEGPHWRPDKRLWLVDKGHKAVYAVTADGDVETIAEGLFSAPNGITWLPDGRLLMGMESCEVLRVEPDGSVVEHVDLRPHIPVGYISEIIADPQGYVYVAHVGFDMRSFAPFQPASILRIDPDLTVSVAADDLRLPNNMSLRDNGTTLVSSEMLAQQLTMWDIGANGALSNRRAWATFGDPMGSDDLLASLQGDANSLATLFPDGHTNDAEGAIWAADVSYPSRCVRIGQGGEIFDEIRVEGLNFYACELGGPDGDTLFICAAPEWQNGARSTGTAKLLTCRVEVPALGWAA